MDLGACKHFSNILGDLYGGAQRGRRQQTPELLASQPAEHGVSADLHSCGAAKLDQRQIASVMAVPIIYSLEVIKVKDKCSSWQGGCAAQLQNPSRVGEEPSAIENASQRIDACDLR